MVHYKKLFYFDLETTTEYKDFDTFKEASLNGAKSFEIKYNRGQINKDKYWEGSINDAYINNGPLMPEYGKIICISYGFFKGDKFTIISKTINDYNSEKDFILFIQKLLNRVEQKGLYLIGHNIKHFDIPFIFKKMLKYGIKIPYSIDTHNKKPWEVIFYDTGELTKNGSFYHSSLADLSYLLDIPTSKDDISGSDVYNVYWEDNDVERIKKYCEKDVIAVKDVVLRLYSCLNN